MIYFPTGGLKGTWNEKWSIFGGIFTTVSINMICSEKHKTLNQSQQDGICTDVERLLNTGLNTPRPLRQTHTLVTSFYNRSFMSFKSLCSHESEFSTLVEFISLIIPPHIWKEVDWAMFCTCVRNQNGQIAFA